MVSITQAVLHVLDTNIDLPVLSDTPLTLDPDTEAFLSGHIERLYASDDCKLCRFLGSSKFQAAAAKCGEHFLPFTRDIAGQIFTVMKQNPDIPAGDLVFAQAEIDEHPYLILLKLNYRDSYIHYYMSPDGQERSNTIMRQRTTFPQPKSKIDEGALVSLNGDEVRLMEKKYEIDGKKACYLSEQILECSFGISEKQKLTAVQKAVETVNEKFFDNKQEIEVHVANVLCEQAGSDDAATLDALCDSIYGGSPAEVKEEFTRAVAEKDLHMSDTVRVSPTAANRLKKQSIKTENGIEIKIPIDVYNSGDGVQFINNPDGSISLLIKGIHLS